MLLCALMLATAAAPKLARGTPTSPPVSTETSEAWLAAAVARPRGLKAADVAARAVETSLTVKLRDEDVNAASAGVGQATVAWLPRVAATARYARLSPIEEQTLGNVVVAPMASVG